MIARIAGMLSSFQWKLQHMTIDTLRQMV